MGKLEDMESALAADGESTATDVTQEDLSAIEAIDVLDASPEGEGDAPVEEAPVEAPPEPEAPPPTPTLDPVVAAQLQMQAQQNQLLAQILQQRQPQAPQQRQPDINDDAWRVQTMRDLKLNPEDPVHVLSFQTRLEMVAQQQRAEALERQLSEFRAQAYVRQQSESVAQVLAANSAIPADLAPALAQQAQAYIQHYAMPADQAVAAVLEQPLTKALLARAAPPAATAKPAIDPNRARSVAAVAMPGRVAGRTQPAKPLSDTERRQKFLAMERRGGPAN